MEDFTYKIGDVIKGTVTEIRPYGVLIDFGDGINGLLHISEISDRYVSDITYFCEINTEIAVKIIDINEHNHFLRVSLKQVPVDQRLERPKRKRKKYVFNKDDYDFTPLKEALPKWIKNSTNRNEVNMNLRLDDSHIIKKINYDDYKDKVNEINDKINNKTGLGNDYLGWADYPVNYDKDEFARIKKAASYIREHFETLVVIGVGGSYLGARAAIEALRGLYPDDKMEVIFIGNSFSPTYLNQVLNRLKTRNFAINVISKSGTTTETAIAFRLIRQLLIEKVGVENSKKAIFVTTDKEKGALKTLSVNEGYETFTLPSDIGGRYSVLTPVGILPLAAAGINVDDLMSGAAKAREDILTKPFEENDAYKYACIRDFMYRNNYKVELFVVYEPHFAMLNEWLKQLYGETEGKGKKGLLPDSVVFSTDLHSLGQFIQDGSPVLFETLIYVNNPKENVTIPFDDENLDGLNYIAGKPLSFVNEQAFKGTMKAHVDEGGVPNVVLNLDKLDAFTLGYFFYFFMRSCAMSAYLLDVNPFNQPGVEVYKRNMFHLLGKEGY